MAKHYLEDVQEFSLYEGNSYGKDPKATSKRSLDDVDPVVSASKKARNDLGYEGGEDVEELFDDLLFDFATERECIGFAIPVDLVEQVDTELKPGQDSGRTGMVPLNVSVGAILENLDNAHGEDNENVEPRSIANAHANVQEESHGEDGENDQLNIFQNTELELELARELGLDTIDAAGDVGRANVPGITDDLDNESDDSQSSYVLNFVPSQGNLDDLDDTASSSQAIFYPSSEIDLEDVNRGETSNKVRRKLSFNGCKPNPNNAED